jgi:hypothetical protein
MKKHAITIVALAVCCGVIHLVPRVEAAFIEIPAWSFDRGNARVVVNPEAYFDYRDIHPNLVVTGGDELPWEVEYDIDFPVDATYTLKIRYASELSRPIELSLDGQKVATVCGGTTGNSGPYPDRMPAHAQPPRAESAHGAKWEEVCTLSVSNGTHQLKLARKGPPPRLLALRLESTTPFPRGWQATAPSIAVLDKTSWMWSPKYAARTRYNMGFAHADPKMSLDRIPVAYRRALMPPGGVRTATLRLAIEDMITQYGEQFGGGPEALVQLTELDGKRAAPDFTPEQLQQVEEALTGLQQEAMLDHPLLNFDKLLFVKRFTETSGHIYEDPYGGTTLGGNLCVLSPVAPDGKVIEVVPELAGGLFGRFDLSFDATRIVFAYKKTVQGSYRIYEVGIDPSTGRAKANSLRQLTFAVSESEPMHRGRGYDDIDPCYLPNGKIMFASTRSERVVFCFGTAVTTLHVMDGDGKNMRRISEGPITEIDPCVMEDGRVIYMRWEYVDKGFGNVQSLWSMNPDGSGSAHVYKNNIVVPGGMVDPRSIPGSPKIVTIAAPHCGLSVGAVVLLDTRADRRSGKAMLNITPGIGYPGMFHHAATHKYGYFKEPFPLSEKLFLVAHSPYALATKPTGYGLYLLDSWGNRTELYRDPRISCFQPVPLHPRRKPTTIATVSDGTIVAGGKDRRPGTLFLQDVYQGMPGIERGRVKYLRVMEALALSWDAAQRAGRQQDGAGLQMAAVSMSGDVHLKKVHGVVPVHEDGSACFTVPSRKNLYFQALDKDYMELQRMRTFVNVMPGEQRSCVGCHEPRRQAPSARRDVPQALTHAPMPLAPQPGDTGPRMVHYVTDIQPIFDKHCISCHGGSAPSGELDLSGALTTLYTTSYESLVDSNLVSYLYGCFGAANIPPEPSVAFGSHRSKLVERIQKAPCKADLSREEFIKIVTWVDANAPFYGTHDGKKNVKWQHEPNFRPMPLASK